MTATLHQDTSGRRSLPALAITPKIQDHLRSGCVVAVGVSGGKDSNACAIAVSRHLDEIGHAGPRVLVHSDLGRVEWKESLPSCQRLAAALGWELMIVRRQAGDLLARWEKRWNDNLARYAELECVQVILPWSTSSMRFCTSELKTDVIASALKKRFPGFDIVSATGIRRDESAARRRKPVAARSKKLSRRGLEGWDWHPIIEWAEQEVWTSADELGIVRHEAYRIFGAPRVSCAFCVLGSEAALRAAIACKDNRSLYRSLVELEANSTFAFQGHRWLADVAPELLSTDLKTRIVAAKEKAAQRIQVEAIIPKSLRYTDGWPTVLPSIEEAEVLAGVRKQVAAILGIAVKYTTAETVRERFAELIALKVAHESAKAERARRKQRRRLQQKLVE